MLAGSFPASWTRQPGPHACDVLFADAQSGNLRVHALAPRASSEAKPRVIEWSRREGPDSTRSHGNASVQLHSPHYRWGSRQQPTSALQTYKCPALPWREVHSPIRRFDCVLQVRQIPRPSLLAGAAQHANALLVGADSEHGSERRTPDLVAHFRQLRFVQPLPQMLPGLLSWAAGCHW